MLKKYAIQIDNDKVISVKVDGVTYDSPDQILDPEDRAQILRLLSPETRADWTSAAVDQTELFSDGADELATDLFVQSDQDFDHAFEPALRTWPHSSEDTFSPSSDGSSGGLDPFFKIFLGIFSGVSVLLLAIAAVSAHLTYQRVAQEERAPGRVVQILTRSNSSGGSPLSYPVVEFTLPNDRRQTVEIPIGSFPPAYSEGESVTLLYHPDHPNDARIQSFASTLMTWFIPGLTGGMGAIFAAITLGVFGAVKPKPPQREF